MIFASLPVSAPRVATPPSRANCPRGHGTPHDGIPVRELPRPAPAPPRPRTPPPHAPTHTPPPPPHAPSGHHQLDPLQVLIRLRQVGGWDWGRYLFGSAPASLRAHFLIPGGTPGQPTQPPPMITYRLPYRFLPSSHMQPHLPLPTPRPCQAGVRPGCGVGGARGPSSGTAGLREGAPRRV